MKTLDDRSTRRLMGALSVALARRASGSQGREAATGLGHRRTGRSSHAAPGRSLQSALRNVTAAWISRAQLPLLRRLAYALPHATIVQVRIAITSHGAFVRAPAGIDAIPLGTFFSEVHPRAYVLAGRLRSDAGGRP